MCAFCSAFRSRLMFLAGVMVVTGYGLPHPPPVFWLWVVAGALTQIGATATMLSVMGERSFVVAYAYIKTEPVQVALFGLIFLGDKITPLSGAGDPDRHRRRHRDLVEARRRQRQHQALDRDRLAVGLVVRALGDRLSRRDSVAAPAAFRHGRDLHAGGRAGAAGGPAVGLSGAARPGRVARHRQGLEALAVRRLHGRLRLAILVPRLSPSPPPPMCARWRWSRCCSRKA